MCWQASISAARMAHRETGCSELRLVAQTHSLRRYQSRRREHVLRDVIDPRGVRDPSPWFQSAEKVALIHRVQNPVNAGQVPTGFGGMRNRPPVHRQVCSKIIGYEGVVDRLRLRMGKTPPFGVMEILTPVKIRIDEDPVSSRGPTIQFIEIGMAMRPNGKAAGYVPHQQTDDDRSAPSIASVNRLAGEDI